MADRTEQFMNFCCDLGRQMIQSGAEIYRVEETLTLLIRAYGYLSSEVFAIPSFMALTIEDEERNHSKIIRIRASGRNMDKLERLNELCRNACRETPPLEVLRVQLSAVAEAPGYSPLVSYLAYGGVAAFSALFWGGCLLDSGISFLCGLIIRAILTRLRRLNANVFFANIAACLGMMALPLLLLGVGVPLHLDMVVIGSIMVLVPGVAITNAMRDVLAGDFVTALTTCAEVAIVSAAIAVGIAIPIAMFQFIPGVI